MEAKKGGRGREEDREKKNRTDGMLCVTERPADVYFWGRRKNVTGHLECVVQGQVE